MDPVIVEQLGREHPLARHLGDFLTDQKNANASANTVRAYRGDLLQFTAHCDGEFADLTAAPIRAFLADIGELSAATRKRKRAAVSSFCRWAVRQDRLDTNP
jgi:integrase/recombinase XerD